MQPSRQRPLRSLRLRPRWIQTPATQADIDAAELEYEGKVAAFVGLDTAVSAAWDSSMAEAHTAVLTVTNPEDMAKA
jgi:hypothetical protein